MERVTLSLSKLEVAEIQLNRAIKLFLSGEDYMSAITLAGAAEEILGKLLNQKGEKNTLEEMVEASVTIGKRFIDESVSNRGVVNVANYYRDRLKHLNDGEDLYFSADYEAAHYIDRASSNYFRLTGSETAEMIQFKEAGYFPYESENV